MIEKKLVGTWRSYKQFYFSGKVEVHNTSFFTELSIDQNNCLTMFHTLTKRQATVLQPGEWQIEEMKKRRYLYFGKKQAFEIITLDPEDLVLADVVKGEKLFFAKLPGWYQRIEPVITSVRRVNPEEEKKSK